MVRQNYTQMFPSEWRVGITLSGMYALRMLDMFLVLPVLSLYMASLPDAENNKAPVDMVMGVYGLARAALQLPLGIASDKFSCKKVTYVGLIVFAVGSFLAAVADSLHMLVAARAVQGADAVSAAITALLADLTRDEIHTRAMAVIGLSIGLTFSISLVLTPITADFISMPGLFMLTDTPTVSSIAMVTWMAPNPEVSKSHKGAQTQPSRIDEVLRNHQLLTLDFNIFAPHTAQMALFITLPFTLENLGLTEVRHWRVYLPSAVTGLIVMVPLTIVGETRGKLKQVFVFGIACIALARAGLLFGLHSIWPVTSYLVVYFIGFSVLEVSLPLMVSKITPPDLKSAAMGVHNALQSAGLFVGGASGGLLSQHYGFASIFAFCCVLIGVWLLVTLCSSAPDPVKNISMPVGMQWRGSTDLLFRTLSKLDSIENVAFSADRQTVYVKALQKGFDQETAEKIISGV